ncbi:cold shock domain-containing protein [uncultured Sanguibacteroides sp.]|uniref:cold-shock protein n=1 Tax=uncultured Sanguibacteroides sp. TaxID=1635151 RepID=UPI0025CC960A|nr:cold shock domain-containing protein [uncultured Sanguibacteroides sp.]
MARSAILGKRENEKKKQARRMEKQNRKEERKQSGKISSFDDMIAYVDKNGVITSTPPEDNDRGEEINQEEILISTPPKEAPAILKGRVEHFNTLKGYGFIKDLAGTDKYFFHVDNVLADVTENDIVTFDLERGKRSMNAINICVIDKSEN